MAFLKAQFGVKWALILVIVSIILIIAAMRPYQSSVEEAIRTSAFLHAKEIAGIINLLQIAPEGTSYTYFLPEAECEIRIGDDVNVTIKNGDKRNSYIINLIKVMSNPRKVDSGEVGGDLLCGTGEVVCGAQNLAGANYVLDMIYCCPISSAVIGSPGPALDSGEVGGDLLCGTGEVVCGAQNLASANDQLEKIYCCPVTGVGIGPNNPEPVDSGEVGGDLFCGTDEVVCGAQNLDNGAGCCNYQLDKIYCCPIYGADYGLRVVGMDEAAPVVVISCEGADRVTFTREKNRIKADFTIPDSD